MKCYASRQHWNFAKKFYIVVCCDDRTADPRFMLNDYRTEQDKNIFDTSIARHKCRLSIGVFHNTV